MGSCVTFVHDISSSGVYNWQADIGVPLLTEFYLYVQKEVGPNPVVVVPGKHCLHNDHV